MSRARNVVMSSTSSTRSIGNFRPNTRSAKSLTGTGSPTIGSNTWSSAQQT